jgi:hypothetical protein
MQVLSTRSKSYEAYRVCLVGYFVPPSDFEAQKQVELAQEHINQAVNAKIDDYMWSLACVHQKLR